MPSDYWSAFNTRRASRRRFMQTGAIAGVGAAGLALVGCGNDDDDDASTPAAGNTAAPNASPGGAASPAPVVRGGTLRFPMSGASSANPPTIFPFENLTYLAQTPSGAYYSRLLRGKNGPDIHPNDNTAMEGDLAAKMPEQPDPLTMIFTMKPNVKWHDKAPMNGRAATASVANPN